MSEPRTHNARLLMIATIALVTLTSACSPRTFLHKDKKSPAGSAASTTVDASGATTSVAGVTTTTAAAAEPTGADEPLTECATAEFKAAFKTKMIMGKCTTTWATGNTDRDTWNCPDAGCRQVSIYHLSGTWSKTAVCDTTQPLTYWKGSCYHEDMTAVQASDIPPASIQCKIWPANTQIAFLEETGCEITKDVIAGMMTGKCDHWTQNLNLPLVKCDSGQGVRTAQQALRKAGRSTSIDGFFGPTTAKAVYEFQKKSSITPTGMIDVETWKALFPGNSGLPGKDRNADGVITPDEF